MGDGQRLVVIVSVAYYKIYNIYVCMRILSWQFPYGDMDHLIAIKFQGQKRFRQRKQLIPALE